MALEVGRLVAYVEADDSQLEGGLSRSESRFAKFGSAVGRTMLAAGAAVVGIGGMGLKMGLQTAAGMEQADIGFTTMLGSGQAAQAFLSKLSAFAATTPFEFPELQTAASSLVSAGVAANDVIPIMTSLGNATSGMGTGAEGVKRATVAIQQMNAAGKISAEDLNQLRDAGIPVYDLLAAATGKSKEAVAQLANTGKLGRKELEQLMDALKSGRGLERFSGLMDKQSQSLTGLVSTLHDTVSMGLAQAVQPLIPTIKEGLGGAITFIQAQVPHLTAAFAVGAEAAKDFIAGVTLKDAGDIGAPLDGWVAKGYKAREVFFQIKAAAQGLYDLIVNGDYTGNLSKAFGWEEDTSSAVDVILRIRDAAIGLYQLIVNGDYRSNLLYAFDWAEDDKAVDWILNVRDAVTGFFTSIKSGDTSKLSGDFHTIVESGKELGPIFANAYRVFQQVTSILPSFDEILHGVAVTMQFMADHADAIAVALPIAAAAFGLYKVAVAAGNVVMLASVPLEAGKIASNILLASALRASAKAAQESATSQIIADNMSSESAAKRGAAAVLAGARTVGSWVAAGATAVAQAAIAAGAWVASSARTVAALTAQGLAFVASRAVMLAGAAVTGVVTAAQWALNAAMSANPIALVVIAIAALVAGLVIAYQRSETFRNIVNGAWAAIKIGVGAVVGWLTTAVPAAFSWILNAFLRYTPLGIVISHWRQIWSFIQTAVGGIRAAINWFASLPGLIGGWFGGAKAAATARLGELVSFVQGLPGRIVSAIGDLGGLLVGAGSDIISGLINGISSMGGRLVSFVRDFVAEHIPEPVRKAMGIASPSKVMRDEVGRWIPLGLVEGIKAEAPAVDQAMQDLMNVPVVRTTPRGLVLTGNGTAPLDDGFPGGPGGGRGGSGGYTYAPTYNLADPDPYVIAAETARREEMATP